MQSNFALRKTMPDDPRFFFERIMPSRDGWNAAFCGSNSVTKRPPCVKPTTGGCSTRFSRRRGEERFDIDEEDHRPSPELPESVERNLLIRKIFTAGLNAHTATAVLRSVTFGMLQRMWSAKMNIQVPDGEAQPTEAPEEKLPAVTLIVEPRRPAASFADLAAARQNAA